MKHLLACLCAWFTLAIAHAAPVRPLYDPPQPPPARQTSPDLRGTSWHGVESADRNIYFHADGSLAYTPSQKGFGSWRQEGNMVYFEFNGKYREFRGTIQGSVIQGDSWNIKGKRWVTVLQRSPAK